MLYIAQCRNVPDGASGSSTRTMKLRVSGGASCHSSGGERFSPSRVCRIGMTLPCLKAGLVRVSGMVSSSGVLLPEFNALGCGGIRIDHALGERTQTFVRALL